MYSPSVNYREPIKGVDKNSVKMHYVYNLLLAYFMALSLIFSPLFLCLWLRSLRSAGVFPGVPVY